MASILGVELIRGRRYSIVAGPTDRQLGTQGQVRNVIYRGSITLLDRRWLVFEDAVFGVLVEPGDITEFVEVQRRFE